MASVQALREQMNRNSDNWHKATTQAEKDRLHQENVRIQKQIDQMTGSSSTFNSSTGKWTTTGGSSNKNTSSSGGKNYNQGSQGAIWEKPGYSGSSGSSGSRPSSGGSSGSSSSRPSSGGSSGTTSPSTGGSASGVQTSTDWQKQIQDIMNQNSLAWWDADEAGKKRLEQENRYWAQILNQNGGNLTFNPGTGTWSGSAGGGTVGGTSSQQGPIWNQTRPTGGVSSPGTSVTTPSTGQQAAVQTPQNIGALYTSNVGGQILTYDRYGNVYAVGNNSNKQHLTPSMVNSGELKAIGTIDDYVTDQYRKQLAVLQRENPNARLGSYLTGIDENDMEAAYTSAGSTYFLTEYGRAIQQAKEDYEAARARGDEAGMQQAHMMAEIARQLHGYTGGADGSLHQMLFMDRDNILPGINGDDAIRDMYIQQMQDYVNNGGLYGTGIQNNLGTNTGAYDNNGAAVTIPERNALRRNTEGTYTKNGTTYWILKNRDTNGNRQFLNPATGKVYTTYQDEYGDTQMVQTGQTTPRLDMNAGRGYPTVQNAVTGGVYTPSTNPSAQSANNPYLTGVDDYGNQDLSVAWDNALSQGADYNTMLSIYQARLNKTASDPYGAWAGDSKQQEMEAWLAANNPANQIQVQTPQLDAVQDYSNYLEDMYDAARRSALAQLNSAYQQNINAIDRAGSGLGESYQNARNQAAGASELAARNFAEYAAASGLNSGAGGQAELARNVALQNNLNDISMQEGQSYADLELQRANAETEYNNAIAQAEADNDYALASALYQEKVRVQQQLLEQQLQQFQMDLQNRQLAFQQQQANIANQQWQQEFDYSTSANQQNQLASYGSAFLEQGLMPSQEMLDAMGITYADAQAYIDRLSAISALSAASPDSPRVSNSRSNGRVGNSNDSKVVAYSGGSGADNSSGGEWAGIDKTSVTALGYGPISRATLESLVDNGQVEAYQDPSSGLIKFRRVSGASSPQILPEGLTSLSDRLSFF